MSVFAGIFFFWGTAGFAGGTIVGELLPEDQIPAAACRIEAPDGRHICSATRIAPETLLTAAHCLIPFRDRKAICADGEVRAVRSHEGHSEYPTRFEKDLAVIRVSPPFEGARMPLPSGPDEMKRLLRAGDCLIAGAGLDAQGKDGTILGAKIRRVDRHEGRGFVFGFEGQNIRGGDSGGTLACRDPENGTLVLVGVNFAGLQSGDRSYAVPLEGEFLEWALARNL